MTHISEKTYSRIFRYLWGVWQLLDEGSAIIDVVCGHGNEARAREGGPMMDPAGVQSTTNQFKNHRLVNFWFETQNCNSKKSPTLENLWHRGRFVCYEWRKFKRKFLIANQIQSFGFFCMSLQYLINKQSGMGGLNCATNKRTFFVNIW